MTTNEWATEMLRSHRLGVTRTKRQKEKQGGEKKSFKMLCKMQNALNTQKCRGSGEAEE